jgi:hypothetical protein
MKYKDNSKIIRDILATTLIFGGMFITLKKNSIFDSTLQSIIELNTSMVGVWATILGFLITSVSILVSVRETKYLDALRKSSHFRELMKIFIMTCYVITFTLILSILITVFDGINICMVLLYLYAFIFCFIRLFTCLQILIKIIDIS